MSNAYFDNQQLIATARADNPRAPDEPEENTRIIDSQSEFDEYIESNHFSSMKIEDLREEFEDRGYVEVEI